MKKTQVKLFVAAGVPVVFAASAALAQFQVNTGNALDANNQAGVGGSNVPVSPYTQPQPLYNGNNVVTGNVTQGRQFRGGITYTDPNALRTNTAGQALDRFNANSVGVPQSYQQTTPAYVAPRAFLGQSQAARTPAGYQLNNFSGNYVAQQAPRPLGYTTQVNVPPAGGLNAQDIGLAAPNLADTGTVSGAPLYVPSQSGFQNYQRMNTPDSLRLNDRALEQMRMELNQTIAPGFDVNASAQRQQQQPGAGQSGQGQPAPGQPGQGGEANVQVGITAQPLNPQALGTPTDTTAAGAAPSTGAPAGSLSPTALTAAPMSDRLGAPQRGGAQAGGAAAAVVPPSRQSSQYAQLQQRLTQFESQMGATPGALPGQPGAIGSPPQPVVPGTQAPQQPTIGTIPGAGTGVGTAADADLLPSRREREKRAAAAKADEEKGLTAAERDRRRTASMYPPSVPNKPSPLEVKSLATGVQAKGLHDLLTDAEKMMREQKYAAALERYDAAERVAPNNPLVWLGRAHTELAAGYYARADRDLRNALSSDRALLMGRYDLEKFLGADRLNTVTSDLKQIANKEKDDVTSPFLLAYVAYNTNNPERAAEYLNLAERRAGGPDPVFRLMRQHWTLPESKQGDAATKP